MNPLMHLEDNFLAIFGRAPAEPGEFNAPTKEEVATARKGLAAHRQRLADATPAPALGTGREGAEL
ncbi:hypothetical protein [Lysobacter sp. HA35]